MEDEDKDSQTYFSPEVRCIISLWAIFKRDVLVLFFLLLLEMASRCFIPVTVQALLSEDESPRKAGVLLTLILLLLMGLFLRHYNGNRGHQIGLKMRALILETLYNKMNSLHSTVFTCSDKKYTQKVDQYLTRDLQNIEQRMYFLLITLTMPFTLIFAAGLLFYWNNLSGIIGFCYFLLMFLVHIVINLCVENHTKNISSLAMQKLGLLKEILLGIRLIKISTWEKAFYKMMTALNDQESLQIFAKYFLLFVERSISLSSPAVASMIIFLSKYYMSGGLDSSQIFVTFQLLLSIRYNVMYFSQMGIDYFYELKDFFRQFRETLAKEEFNMRN